MIRVRVIERRLPHGWETLLEVNGVIGRAEELLCVEEIPWPTMLRSKLVSENQVACTADPWYRPQNRFIGVIHPPVESASFVET
jgi:hypothetical protein